MAINPSFVFRLRARLDETLEAIAELEGGLTDDAPGAFGSRPRVALRGDEVQIEAQPDARGRWWMSHARRRRAAPCRSGRLVVGEGFATRICQPGDVLRLGLGLMGDLQLSVDRRGVCLLACESGDDVSRQGLRDPSLYRLDAVGAGGPSQQAALSMGGIRSVAFAVLKSSGISHEDATACARGLLLSRVQTEGW